MTEQPRLEEILITSRPLANYLDFFDLSESDLVGKRILDCPGGASSFTAEARHLGADAFAVDPTYTLDTAQLAVQGNQQIEVSDSWFRSNPDLFFEAARGEANIEAIIADRRAALATFLRDIEASPGRYLAASLPTLPFRDNSFDLVLCSHLLFCYADRFDRDFHLAAIEELLRVSSADVRIYPLSDYVGVTPEWLDSLVAALISNGFGVETRDVPFRVTKNWTTQLVITTD